MLEVLIEEGFSSILSSLRHRTSNRADAPMRRIAGLASLLRHFWIPVGYLGDSQGRAAGDRTLRMSENDRGRETRELIVDVAYREVGRLPYGGMVAFLRPKILAEVAAEILAERGQANRKGPSPSTVSSHFPTEGHVRKLDHQALAHEMLGRALDDRAAQEREAADEYERAIDALAAGDGGQALRSSLHGDIDRYLPGYAEATDSREWVWFAALAAAAEDLTVQRRLHRSEAAGDGLRVALYDQLLEVLDRRMVTGFTTHDLAVHVVNMLNGDTIRRRIGNAPPETTQDLDGVGGRSLTMSKLWDALLRLILVYTVPRSQPVADDPSDAARALFGDLWRDDED